MLQTWTNFVKFGYQTYFFYLINSWRLNLTKMNFTSPLTGIYHSNPTPDNVVLLDGIPKFLPYESINLNYMKIDSTWEIKKDFTTTYTITVDELNLQATRRYPLKKHRPFPARVAKENWWGDIFLLDISILEIMLCHSKTNYHEMKNRMNKYENYWHSIISHSLKSQYFKLITLHRIPRPQWSLNTVCNNNKQMFYSFLIQNSKTYDHAMS